MARGRSGDDAADRRSPRSAGALLCPRSATAAEGRRWIGARDGSRSHGLLIAVHGARRSLPVYVMLSASLRTQSDFLNHPLWPAHRRRRLDAYRTALNNHVPAVAPEQPDADHRRRS